MGETVMGWYITQENGVEWFLENKIKIRTVESWSPTKNLYDATQVVERIESLNYEVEVIHAKNFGCRIFNDNIEIFTSAHSEQFAICLAAKEMMNKVYT